MFDPVSKPPLFEIAESTVKNWQSFGKKQAKGEIPYRKAFWRSWDCSQLSVRILWPGDLSRLKKISFWPHLALRRKSRSRNRNRFPAIVARDGAQALSINSWTERARARAAQVAESILQTQT